MQPSTLANSTTSRRSTPLFSNGGELTWHGVEAGHFPLNSLVSVPPEHVPLLRQNNPSTLSLAKRDTDASIALEWQSAFESKEPIPTINLFPQ
jgi:hypothetical protein